MLPKLFVASHQNGSSSYGYPHRRTDAIASQPIVEDNSLRHNGMPTASLSVLAALVAAAAAGMLAWRRRLHSNLLDAQAGCYWHHQHAKLNSLQHPSADGMVHALTKWPDESHTAKGPGRLGACFSQRARLVALLQAALGPGKSHINTLPAEALPALVRHRFGPAAQGSSTACWDGSDACLLEDEAVVHAELGQQSGDGRMSRWALATLSLRLSPQELEVCLMGALVPAALLCAGMGWFVCAWECPVGGMAANSRNASSATHCLPACLPACLPTCLPACPPASEPARSLWGCSSCADCSAITVVVPYLGGPHLPFLQFVCDAAGNVVELGTGRHGLVCMGRLHGTAVVAVKVRKIRE